MNERSFTCIVCPNGCRLTASFEDGAWKVSGNKCPRGVDYAVAEMTAPVRTVTAVVRTASARMPYAPARTDKPIDRELVFPLLAAIYASEAGASFKRGDTLIENFKGSGVNVILCRDEDR